MKLELNSLVISAVFAATLSTSSGALASQSRSKMVIGHNVSPTSYTLGEGEVSIGTYVIGYGITDHWMIATSPWMIVQYNMPTIATRYSFEGDQLIHRFAFEFEYFKTFEYGFNLYKQESFFLRLIATHRVSPRYTVHLSGGYQHFFDDTAPYSIRPVWNMSDPTPLSAGVLHEFTLGNEFGLFIETATFGLNYPVVYAHLGLSLYTRQKWGFAQIGFSRSMPLDQPGWHEISTKSGITDWTYLREASFHPEIQLQFALN